MIPQIFISYSRKDSDFVRRLVDDLTSRGVDIWLDQRDIKAGERWDTSVQNGLRDSDYFMVVLSPESVSSENVMDEIAYAMSKAKHVFPILFRDCDVPYRLARVQYVDFRESYEDGLERLLEQIQLAGVPIRSLDRTRTEFWTPQTQSRHRERDTNPHNRRKEGASAPRSKAKVPVWLWAVGGVAGVAVLVLLILIARGSSPEIPPTPNSARLQSW